MSHLTFKDRERQEDELSTISSIFDYYEFSYSKEDAVKCSFNIFLNTHGGELVLKSTYHNDQRSVSASPSDKLWVQYLPPVRLNIHLPEDYPSKHPPTFHLSISWLPPWETSFVCQKLDELWKENEGSEILFLWLDFLKNDLLKFLHINDSLDISFMYMMYDTPDEYPRWNLTSFIDSRAANRALFLNPVQFLKEYDKDQYNVEFEKKFHKCFICFDEHVGQKCVQLKCCGHIFCRGCIQKYITYKIDKDNVKNITCPSFNCGTDITNTEVKENCPELFSKYEKLVLQLTLSNMSDIVYCPRTLCQSPVIKEPDETLAICSNCCYSFCTYCFKSYHGVEPCLMTSAEISSLVQDYQSGTQTQKKKLEEKYGRKQIQRVVEKHLSEEYLKTNAKSCPNCQTLVTKIDGCNKMICIHCQASFCWLCGAHITTANAYDHFVTRRGTCYGRLFEGIYMEDLNNFDDLNVIENALV